MINRIARHFHDLKEKNRKALIPYITPEFPVPETTVPLVLALEKAGATMVEIGIPFSDPLADGPTIQHSSEVAIRNGATISRIFGDVRKLRESSEIPVVLMGYINPIVHYGVEKFLRDAHECGVDGLIIPDMPPEESGEICSMSKKYGLSNVFLIAPTSDNDRIRVLDGLSSDFTYCVSVTGVTGARNSFGNSFDHFLQRVKHNTTKPFVVGFGIKGRDQIERISTYADGVVIGSALLNAIGNARTVPDAVQAAADFISTVN
jgi:tryptophan synthase alpha chain